ncbi:MAG: GTP cyclohydrolase II [Pseudonocardiales bacterium]|nr:MAG: GTP cyclohydrolase II [Pseudonocardiales bacterium]
MSRIGRSRLPVGHHDEMSVDGEVLRSPPEVERRSEARIRLADGVFRAVGYWDPAAGREQIAFVCGAVTDADGADVLVRVHSECLTGDIFGSLRCDCGPQLTEALSMVAREGRGVVVYARGHEGRGIGLVNKLRAYRLQEAGSDTIDANVALGFPVDGRDYGVSAAILHDLGVRSVCLLSNNPAKRAELERYGVRVTTMIHLSTSANQHNLNYLQTKRDRMGHAVHLQS